MRRGCVGGPYGGCIVGPWEDCIPDRWGDHGPVVRRPLPFGRF